MPTAYQSDPTHMWAWDAPGVCEFARPPSPPELITVWSAPDEEENEKRRDINSLATQSGNAIKLLENEMWFHLEKRVSDAAENGHLCSGGETSLCIIYKILLP